MLKLASLAFAATLFAAASAAADEVAFKYQTYELETAGGAEALHSRLMARAKRLCRASDRNLSTLQERCTEKLADEWVAKINDERLSAIHDGAS